MNKEQFHYIEFIQSLVLSHVNDSFSDDVALYIGCQSALESFYGKSRRALDSNNVFGMKIPRKRLSIADCSGADGFSKYACFLDSVLDYLYWLCYNHVSKQELNDVSSFSKFLVRKNYGPDAVYINRINRIYENYKQIKKSKIYE